MAESHALDHPEQAAADLAPFAGRPAALQVEAGQAPVRLGQGVGASCDDREQGGDDGDGHQRQRGRAHRARHARGFRRHQRQARSAGRSAGPGSAGPPGTAAGPRPARRPSGTAGPRRWPSPSGRSSPGRAGPLGSSMPQARRLRVRDLLDQLRPVRGVEGRPQRQQLVERQAQAVDVGPGVALPLEPLRGHVAERARGCRRSGSGRPRPALGQAEVGDPDRAVRSSSRFDGLMSRWRIPCWWAYSSASATWMPIRATLRMYGGRTPGPRRTPTGQANRIAGGLAARAVATRRVSARGADAIVSILDGRASVGPRHERGRCEPAGRPASAAMPAVEIRRDASVLRDRSAAASPAFSRLSSSIDLVQPLALDELHDVVVPPAVLADAEDRHDVRVVQPRRRPGLALEPLDHGAGSVSRRVGQDLQRHAAAERFLLGLVDDPHAAPADLAHDPEVAQTLRPCRRPPRPRRRARSRSRRRSPRRDPPSGSGAGTVRGSRRPGGDGDRCTPGASALAAAHPLAELLGQDLHRVRPEPDASIVADLIAGAAGSIFAPRWCRWTSMSF